MLSHLMSKWAEERKQDETEAVGGASLSDAGSYLLSPLVQTVQVMHVGTAPVALHRGLVVSEDTSLVGGALSGGGAGAGAGAGVTAAERRRFFSVRSNLVGLSFDPGLVYTPRGCVAKVGCTPRA